MSMTPSLTAPSLYWVVASPPPAAPPQKRLVVLGLERTHLRDIYHAVLTRSWSLLLGGIAVIFLAVNALFALVYWQVGGIANAHGYADCFFFSVQTLATIGYGAMYPQGTAAEVLVVGEAVFSLIMTALATGLVFAKFSRAPARFRFSRWACIGMHHGTPSLMIRLGNQRGSMIVEAMIHVTLSRTEITAEGETFYRLLDLPLVRTRAPALSRSWTVIHKIDATSELFGATAETFKEWDCEFQISVAGTDEVTLQPVHARHTYDFVDVQWDMRHADLLTNTPEEFRVDLRRFDDIVPADGKGAA